MEFGIESETKDFMVERNGKRFIDLTKILPERLPSGKLILWKQIDEEKIEIFVDKHSAPGGNPKPIRIKRFIEINELLFEGLGLRFGDGLKIQGGKKIVFGFSNTNLELHKHFLKFAKECLGIDSKEFRVALTIPPVLSDKIKELEEKISRELRIPLENFFTARILEKSKQPIINTKINSAILGRVIERMFQSLKDILLNRTFSAAFLKGVIASEANISLRNGKLDEISIGSKEKPNRELIRLLLLNLSIFPNKDKEIEGQEAVLLHGLSNFRKMREWNLVSLHPEKFEAFERGLKGFKKEEFRKGEAKLLILQSLTKSSKNITQLAKELGRAWRSIVDHLWVLEDLGLVGRRRVSRRVIWFITEKGKEMLKDENALEKLRIGLPRKKSNH